MAKITKPDMTYVWASGGSKTAPSSVKIQTGWIVEKPEFEKMNWVQNRQDEFRYRREAVYTTNFTPPTAPFTY